MDPLGLAEKYFMKLLRNQPIPSFTEFGLKGDESSANNLNIEALEQNLRKMYCGSIGVEFDHLED